jgi:hypothetical protein
MIGIDVANNGERIRLGKKASAGVMSTVVNKKIAKGM